MFFKKAAIVAVAFAGQAYVDAVTIQKRDGAHGHGHSAAAAPSAPASGYGAPASSYGAPAQSYASPAESYGAPAQSYGAPAESYGAPSDGYGAPSDGYGAPATGYGAAPAGYGAEDGEIAGPGLLPIIIGILALVGLSLLFPTFVSLSSVRRKRSALEEAANPLDEFRARVNDIYGAVLTSESCMEKIACELGAMAKEVTSSPVLGMVEPFFPSKYTSYYKQFKSGKNCDKIKCGKY